MSQRTTVIEQRLRGALAAERVDITDESALHVGHAGAAGGSGHYAVTVVSTHFNGLSSIERHRLVYAALGELMQSGIHALSIRALTLDER